MCLHLSCAGTACCRQVPVKNHTATAHTTHGHHTPVLPTHPLLATPRTFCTSLRLDTMYSDRKSAGLASAAACCRVYKALQSEPCHHAGGSSTHIAPQTHPHSPRIRQPTAPYHLIHGPMCRLCCGGWSMHDEWVILPAIEPLVFIIQALQGLHIG
jgi:hypothetical protein